MSEPLCLECLFKRGQRISKKDILNRNYRCKDCVHGKKHTVCIDGCGTTMVWCDIVEYWHDGDKVNKCIRFIKKEIKKKKTNKIENKD